MVPHLLVPHLFWVVVSLLGAAASGRVLAASLEDEEPRGEPLWLSAAAFAVWCWVSAFAIWWTL